MATVFYVSYAKVTIPEAAPHEASADLVGPGSSVVGSAARSSASATFYVSYAKASIPEPVRAPTTIDVTASESLRLSEAATVEMPAALVVSWLRLYRQAYIFPNEALEGLHFADRAAVAVTVPSPWIKLYPPTRSWQFATRPTTIWTPVTHSNR